MYVYMLEVSVIVMTILQFKKKGPVQFLGPCVVLLVAILCIISNHPGLANCTLTRHIY